MKGYKEISTRLSFNQEHFSEYQNFAFDFCQTYGVKVYLKQVPERKDRINNDRDVNHYHIIITRNNKRWNFYFSGSIYGKMHGEVITCYDILACIEKSFDGDMGDFISEFGYTITSEKEYRYLEKLYKAVKREAANVKRMFGSWNEPCYMALCEIV